MTVLRDCVLVSDLESRLYKGAVRKNAAYRGKIVTVGGKSYIRRSDLLPRHQKAAQGLEVIDRAVPLFSFYTEVAGLSKQDAIRLIVRSHKERIAGRIMRRKHGVYVKVEESTARLLERMTPFCVNGAEDLAYAVKRAVIGNLCIGFY